jgi:superfamily II DNA or RNA helicase
MNLLPAHPWLPKYTPEHGNLVEIFYIPALQCAKQYDRATGYFSAGALALAARGIEGLLNNGGHMRLLVGATLGEAEAEAIRKGLNLREALESGMVKQLQDAPAGFIRDSLELLAWMVADKRLDVRVGVPCDDHKQPLGGEFIYHEKAGIMEDAEGNRLAFSGSLNETPAGWLHNTEAFHVYTSWGKTAEHLAEEEKDFATLWHNRAKFTLVVEVPDAVKQALLTFAPPKGELPLRLKVAEQPGPYQADPQIPPAEPPGLSVEERRRLIWSFIHHAPTFANGGERVGEVTSAVIPWPHQARAFHRMYGHWPPNLLIADEVGLGKTIQAGLLLRQAWLAGKAKRILLLVPKAVIQQWQLELREKFNLHWPIYDGKALSWCKTPARRNGESRAISRQDWHKEPVVLASSHLMRRSDRLKELLEDAAPWDLIILDEAHHARRKGVGSASEKGPNQLLRLLAGLRQRTQGLVLLTATPMQVSPLEVWDLLNLLGLPAEWSEQNFLRFFELSAGNPADDQLLQLARLFGAVEQQYGEVSAEEAERLLKLSPLKCKKILRVLRHTQTTHDIKTLETAERQAAIRLMRAHTPLQRLISRHTRELLRQYFNAGKLTAQIAERAVRDSFIGMTPAEREVYERVEDYIATTYNNAAAEQRSAVGFVMTIYRRRLASSFYALAQTLEGRIEKVSKDENLQFEDLPDNEVVDEVIDPDDAEQLQKQALDAEERGDIEALLRQIRALPTDTKARCLIEELQALRRDYPQAIIFTQYSDTMIFLREIIAKELGVAVLCYSGRGGEFRTPQGDWQATSRDDAKRRFLHGAADILLCTDAAAEGLNFQFCGALVNYDMPWNPMRVEQRIGRIDRLGQKYPQIRIINLHYEDTVETDVYRALRQRIGLFETFVGRLQPILSRLPGEIASVALAMPEQREHARDALKQALLAESDAGTGFDLDDAADSALEELEPTPAPYELRDLQALLARPELLPPGIELRPATNAKDIGLREPGRTAFVRVTTDRQHFEEHAESVELWSPGSPVFRMIEHPLPLEELRHGSMAEWLERII